MSAPERIGRYRVDRRVGSGGFATVWLGRDEVLDAPVAVKVLADNWAHQLDVRERFLEEARILRRADSDRVVRVHDIGELDDGRPYFVMTYADGGTFADLLAAGPVPVADAVRYGAEVARGVAVLHEVGVIHRDVNPANVLLRKGRDGVSDRVLIADLGLAKAAAHASGFTLTVGTPGYMAPEQSSGDGLSKRADVFAVGVLLHHLLSGVAPTAESRPALPDDVPEPVRAVLDQAVRRRPEERFPSAGALADALDDARIASAARPRPQPRPQPRPAPRRVTVPADDDEATERIARPAAPPPPPAAAAALLRRPITGAAEPEPVAGTGPPARTRRRWPVVVLVLVLVAAAGGAGGYGAWLRWWSPTVPVTGEQVALSVPRDWADQRQDGEKYGLRGLLVSGDVTRWDLASTVPGVWVGVGPASWRAGLPPGPAGSCTATSGAAPAGFTGAVRTYRDCPALGTTYTEAVLRAQDGRVVVVQVKGDETAARRTIDSVSLR